MRRAGDLFLVAYALIAGRPPTVVDPTTGTEVVASRGAARRIRKRGGRLYVWFEDGGGPALAVQDVTTDIPAGHDFRELQAPGFRLFLPADYVPPSRLRVERELWPRRVFVSGTGAGGTVP